MKNFKTRRHVTFAVAAVALIGALPLVYRTDRAEGAAARGTSAAVEADGASPMKLDELDVGSEREVAGEKLATGPFGAPKGRRLSFDAWLTDQTSLTATGAGDGGASAQALSVTVQANMSVVVADRHEAELLLLVRFERTQIELSQESASADPKFASRLTEELAEPFWVRLGTDGNTLGYRFTAATSAEGRNWIRGLWSAARFVVPDGAAAEWTAEEEDTAGRLRATYARATAERDPTAEWALRKKLLEYLAGEDQARPSIALQGDGTARFDPSIGWWSSCEIRSVSRVDVSDLGLLVSHEQRARFQLERVQDGCDAGEVDWNGPWASVSGDVEGAAIARDVERERWQRMLATESLDSIVAAIEALLARGDVDPSALYEQMTRLSWLLRLDPAAALDLKQFIFDVSRSDELKAVLLSALGMAGTDQAQGVLAALLGDRSLSDDLRLACAQSAFQPEHPTAAILDRVTTLLRSKSESPELESSVLLLLGALVSRLDSADAQLYLQQILSLEERARGMGNLEAWLGALANSGDPDVVARVAPYLTNQEEHIRIAAIDALRSVGDASVLEAVVAATSNDRSGPVRAAAATFLGDHPAPAALAALQSLAIGDPESFVRRNALFALAPSAATSAVAAQTIQWSAANDPDAELRQLAVQLLGE